MNNVCLSGNICKPVELRKTQSGKSVASFSLAINEGKDKTEFVNCLAWEKTAELLNDYVKKGDRLSLVGRLQTSSWDKDGEKRYKTEVVVTSFDFPPKRSEQSSNEYDQSPIVPAGEKLLDDFEDQLPPF